MIMILQKLTLLIFLKIPMIVKHQFTDSLAELLVFNLYSTKPTEPRTCTSEEEILILADILHVQIYGARAKYCKAVSPYC